MAKSKAARASDADRIAATYEMAASLVDDLEYLRSVAASPGDLRRASGILRRILLEGDLQKVAASRIGRLSLVTAQANPFYRSNEKRPFAFAGVGCVTAFGAMFDAPIVDLANEDPRDLSDYQVGSTIALPLDQFVAQRVICLGGVWLSRRDIIQHIANKAGGVHHDRNFEARDRLIARARQICRLGAAEQGGLRIQFNVEGLQKIDLGFTIEKSSIDVALYQILSTIQYLVTSPDVMRLEDWMRTNPQDARK